MQVAALAFWLMPCVLSNTLDPRHALNITVYHVNQANYSGCADMNTASLRGDMMFALRDVALPVECTVGGGMSSFDCKNPESSAKDLAITELVLEVDSRFGTYAFCNVHMGHYSCVCEDHGQAGPNATVNETDCCATPDTGRNCARPNIGAVNLSKWMAGHHHWHHGNETMQEWEYWRDNIPTKTGGFWYSTSGIAECKPGAAGPCGWRIAQTVKKVNKSCSDASINAALTTGPGKACFDACPQPSNTSSVCFIRCWYKTVLGPHAGDRMLTPSTMGGLLLADLEAAWRRPFRSELSSHGGCPNMLSSSSSSSSNNRSSSSSSSSSSRSVK